MKNWDFQILADRLHLKIFPNSLTECQIGILCIFTLIYMHLIRVGFNFSPVTEKGHKWTFFSHFRTANLNISFNHVEWIFYYFKRVNFEIWEDQIIMAVTKGLYLTIFLISKLSLSDLSHWVMITRKSLGEHTQLFELIRETALTKDLGELKT